MAGRDLDRRQFLAVGGSGLVLCTLAGQRLNNSQPADVGQLTSRLEVPPRVKAANEKRLAGPQQPETVLAAQRANGIRREYWIKAEQMHWNVARHGRDQLTGRKIRVKTKFSGAYGYRAYTKNFGQPITKKPRVPGPLIQCNVGDTVVINFQNTLPSPVTMHPHGIHYTVEMDGAYKGKWTDPGGFVQQGQTFQYVWEATEGTEGAWMYHDHGPLDPVPVFKGLFGPLLVRPANVRPPDREFFIFFHSFQPVATGLDSPLWCINGHSYCGNTPTFHAKVGERVAWHVVALDDYFHTFHLHGHRWVDPNGGQIIDNQTLGPGDSISAEYVEDNPGRWLYHCHVFSHLHQGMIGWYVVK